ncbi:HotDog domain-containing protein [Phlyctochytrium arcticum]|nr:HotDog domain-containing protein [Phlyctochytrium arcticum]
MSSTHDLSKTDSSEEAKTRLVTLIEQALELEELDLNLFRSKELWLPVGARGVFGGQVVGLGLSAATRTVEKHFRVHVGRTYATRSVTAQQRGKVIFTLMASFQAGEASLLSHQKPMPEVKGPEELQSTEEKLQHWLKHPKIQEHPKYREHFEMRLQEHYLLTTSILTHGISAYSNPRLGMIASLDHSVWFHEPFRADEWLLYEMESTRTVAGRGLNFGRIYTQDGRLVVSVAQEGVVRAEYRKDKSTSKGDSSEGKKSSEQSKL